MSVDVNKDIQKAISDSQKIGDEIRITLSELESILSTRSDNATETTIYVFDCEEYAENWIRREYCWEHNLDYEILMTIHSNMRMEGIVKDKWCKAKVEQFYAVAPDVIAVVIESPED